MYVGRWRMNLDIALGLEIIINMLTPEYQVTRGVFCP